MGAGSSEVVGFAVGSASVGTGWGGVVGLGV